MKHYFASSLVVYFNIRDGGFKHKENGKETNANKKYQ